MWGLLGHIGALVVQDLDTSAGTPSTPTHPARPGEAPETPGKTHEHMAQSHLGAAPLFFGTREETTEGKEI